MFSPLTTIWMISNWWWGLPHQPPPYTSSVQTDWQLCQITRTFSFSHSLCPWMKVKIIQTSIKMWCGLYHHATLEQNQFINHQSFFFFSFFFTAISEITVISLDSITRTAQQHQNVKHHSNFHPDQLRSVNKSKQVQAIETDMKW